MMAMNFTPAPVKASSAGTVAVDPEVEKDVKEAWDWFQANPGAHLYTDEFKDEAARNAWERQAKAHADTLGLRFRVVRDDELKATSGDKPRFRFHIETEEAFQARQAEKAAKIADLEARKARGEVITRGRKPGTTVKKG